MMDKMHFTLEQITGSIDQYNKLCNIFLSLAKDNETKTILENVLYEGRVNDFYFGSNISNKDNPIIEGQRRLAMAYLAVRNPETFNYFVNNKINLFHGTNANALPSILKYGLNSAEESHRLGIEVTTGEGGKRRNFVSLTDSLNIAVDYTSFGAQNPKEELSFGIILGTTVPDALEARRITVHSDIPEVGIKNGLPLDNIKVLCVPSDKMDFVSKLTAGSGIKLLPMDDKINERFYFIDEAGDVFIDEEKLEEFKNNVRASDMKGKKFSTDDYNKLASTRLISKIRLMLEKIKNINERGLEDDNRRKHR